MRTIRHISYLHRHRLSLCVLTVTLITLITLTRSDNSDSEDDNDSDNEFLCGNLMYTVLRPDESSVASGPNWSALALRADAVTVAGITLIRITLITLIR